MFEHGSFRNCPQCGQPDSFGVLNVGGMFARRRCKACRYSHSEELPALNKRVIYLDQFAISNLYLVKSGTMPAGANSRAFWVEAEKQVNRAYLLQQAIFPGSNIHDSETIVSPFAAELRLAHEMLSGDTSFHTTEEIELAQALAFAEAYIAGATVPIVKFDVDDVLEGSRNSWLPTMHVTANMDTSFFAPSIRQNRDQSGDAFDALAAQWAAEKPTFKDVLKAELGAYGSSHVEGLRAAQERLQRGALAGDMMEVFEATQSPARRELEALKYLFEERGIAPESAAAEVGKFWNWQGCERIPNHRISAYLFAAIASKMASGQKQPPGRGALNDVRAISCYAPYVDAMLIDNQFAGLLNEKRVKSGSGLDAKVFSLKRGDEFLAYITELADSAPDDVREEAKQLYGIA